MPKRFYHGSVHPLPLKKKLKARGSLGTFGNLEKLFEKHRPKDKPSRLRAWFMVNQTIDVSLAGGSEENVYEVKPRKVSRHHFGWIGQVLKLFPHFKYNAQIARQNQELIRLYLANYWNGVPYRKRANDAGGTVWEYLAVEIKVARKCRR